MDLGRPFKSVFNSREKQRGSASAVPPGSAPATAVTQTPARHTYQDRLARLGGYLEARGAQYICIGELDEGYFLAYGDTSSQTVDTLTFADVTALPAVTAPPLSALLPRHLAAIGRYLDRNLALSVCIDQELEGYYVEYAAPSGGAYTAAHLSRVSRFLDTDAMRNLMMPTGMLPGGHV